MVTGNAMAQRQWAIQAAHERAAFMRTNWALGNALESIPQELRNNSWLNWIDVPNDTRTRIMYVAKYFRGDLNTVREMMHVYVKKRLKDKMGGRKVLTKVDMLEVARYFLARSMACAGG